MSPITTIILHKSGRYLLIIIIININIKYNGRLGCLASISTMGGQGSGGSHFQQGQVVHKQGPSSRAKRLLLVSLAYRRSVVSVEKLSPELRGSGKKSSWFHIRTIGQSREAQVKTVVGSTFVPLDNKK